MLLSCMERFILCQYVKLILTVPKDKRFNNIPGDSWFMDIEYIAQFVFSKWKESYDTYAYMINGIKKYTYDKYIAPLEMQSGTLQERCGRLRDAYYEKIKGYVTLYAKEELMIGLITVKEFITKNMAKLDKKLNYIGDEISCVNILIEFVLSLDTSEFQNNQIWFVNKEDAFGVGGIFVWGRQLTHLEGNIERCKIAEQKKVCLKDMAFDTVEDRVFHDYYEEYEKQGSYEKFEDYEMKDINIQKQTERLKITPNFIRADADQIIQDNFGFSLNTLAGMHQAIREIAFDTEDDLFSYIDDDNRIWGWVAFPKFVFYQLGEVLGVTHDEIDAILQVFSFENKSAREVELSCFLVTENIVYFGPCDMMQIFGIFEKFSLSGHFLDYYKKDIDFIRLLNPCQKKMSTYMSYVLTDILKNAGYKMHIEKFTYNKQAYYSPCAEIQTILNGKINILRDAGDIDVLFLDEYKKQIICVEYKYFQPAVSYEQMYKSDRNKITKQVYEKHKQIQHREDIVKKNTECVAEFLGGSGRDYTVKTMIVLSRPNMYTFTHESSERIKYEMVTMNEFRRRAEEHDL